MARDDLTWETNQSLTYASGNDGRSLRYFEDWRHVTFEFSDFDIVAWHSPFDTDPRIYPLPGDDWKPMTSEARTKYFELRKSAIKPGDNDRGPYMITGKARIDRDEIEVAGVHGGFPGNKDDPAFRMTFREVPVRILATAEDGYGEIRFSHAYEDYPADLSVTLRVQRDRMIQLVDSMLSSTRQPRLSVTVRALLFQDEVSSALNPLWATDTYTLPSYPGGTPAVVSYLNAKYAVPAPARVDEDDTLDDWTQPQEPEAMKTALNPEAMHLLKRINQALWALVGMIGVIIITRAF